MKVTFLGEGQERRESVGQWEAFPGAPGKYPDCVPGSEGPVTTFLILSQFCSRKLFCCSQGSQSSSSFAELGLSELCNFTPTSSCSLTNEMSGGGKEVPPLPQ